MEVRRQIDGNDRIPAVDRELFDRRRVLDSGIVDENIDLAELARRRLDHLLDFGGLRQVGRIESRRVTPKSFAICARSRSIADASPKPFNMTLQPAAAKRSCDAETDAARRASYDCGFSIQQFH